MTYDEILHSINKEIWEMFVSKNGNIICCIRADDISKEIYATIEKFNGDVIEFAVCFKEEYNGYNLYVEYDSVSRFIKDFKDIEKAIEKVRKITNSVVFF